MKILIIALAFVGGLFPILLNLFKRKSSINPIPENVRDVYDEETYAKWRSYNAEHSKLDLISGIISLVLTLVLFATNVYSAFASLFPATPLWQVISVILLETLVSTVVGVGISYYSTMVIEEKYGFNKSTVKTFVIDKIRGFFVSMLLGLFLGTRVGLSIRATGDNPDMVRASSINADRTKLVGLCLSNGLVALSGALIVHYSGYADINASSGTLVYGLAAVIIGETVFGRSGPTRGLIAAILGSVIYKLIVTVVVDLNLFGANSANMMKLMCAVIVAATLGVPALRQYMAQKKQGLHMKNSGQVFIMLLIPHRSLRIL